MRAKQLVQSSAHQLALDILRSVGVAQVGETSDVGRTNYWAAVEQAVRLLELIAAFGMHLVHSAFHLQAIQTHSFDWPRLLYVTQRPTACLSPVSVRLAKSNSSTTTRMLPCSPAFCYYANAPSPTLKAPECSTAS